jgi:hypothetical protein
MNNIISSFQSKKDDIENKIASKLVNVEKLHQELHKALVKIEEEKVQYENEMDEFNLNWKQKNIALESEL